MPLTEYRALLTLVAAGLCVVSVSACQKKPEPQAPVAAKAPAKPKAVLPPRLPGLWQTTVTEDGSEDTPQVLQICIDARTDQHLGILGTDLSGDTCKRMVSRTDDGWGILAECAMGAGGTNEYSGSITGDYSQDFTMKLRLQTTGASLAQMNRVTNYAVVSKRLGDCAPDQRPGDVVNDGVRLNLFGMEGMAVSHAVASGDAPPAPDVVD